MRSFNSAKNILLLTLFLLITSCQPKATHQQAFDYASSIGTQMLDAKSKVETFWAEMKNGVLTAKENSTQQLEKNQIDTLQNHLDGIVADLNNKIDKIKTIVEVDKEINLKESTLTYLIEVKKMQEDDLPLILQLLTNGLDKITIEQKKAVEGFKENASVMQNKSADLQNLFLEFYKKHQITDDELKKNGL